MPASMALSHSYFCNSDNQEQALLQEGAQDVAVSSSNSDERETFSGLFVFGEVVDRTKRTIPNTSTEVVTYTVQANEGRRYYVDEYIQPNEQEKTVMIAENTLRFQFSSRHSEKATVISDIHSVFNKKTVHIQEEFYSKPKLCCHVYALFSGRMFYISSCVSVSSRPLYLGSPARL